MVSDRDRYRGIQAAYAMARPGRTADERRAVERAFEAMPADLSRSAKAAQLAKRVAAGLIEHAEADALALNFALLLAREGDPVSRLVTDSEIDLHSQLAKLRLERFAARGCTWCDRKEWDSETDQVREDLDRALTDRFRRK